MFIDKGRNISHRHHHRRHNSDYYAIRGKFFPYSPNHLFPYTEESNLNNGYMNRTHHEFLRKMGPELDECESPHRVNELLKLNNEELRKSLKEIKKAKLEKIEKNHK